MQNDSGFGPSVPQPWRAAGCTPSYSGTVESIVTPHHHAAASLASPMHSKLVSPTWYEPTSPSSQMEIADLTGNALSPSSSVGSTWRLPSSQLPPPLTAQAAPQVNHRRVTSLHWTPPRPSLRAQQQQHVQQQQQVQQPPPPSHQPPTVSSAVMLQDFAVSTSAGASAAAGAPRQPSPHTPRRQRIVAQHPAHLRSPDQGGPERVTGPVLSPPLRPPPAWSPSMHYPRTAPPPPLAAFTLPSTRPQPMHGAHMMTTTATTMASTAAPAPIVGITTATASGATCAQPFYAAAAMNSLSASSAQYLPAEDQASSSAAGAGTATTPISSTLQISASPSMRRAVPPAPSGLSSPPTYWTPPHHARMGRHAAAAAAAAAAGGQQLRSPAHVTIAPEMAVMAASAGTAVAHTPVHVTLTPTQRTPSRTANADPASADAGKNAHHNNNHNSTYGEDDEDDEEYAVAIDDDGSILSNKDVRRHPHGSYYAPSSVSPHPSYSPVMMAAVARGGGGAASVSDDRPRALWTPQQLGSPFVPFRTPVAVARPLFGANVRTHADGEDDDEDGDVSDDAYSFSEKAPSAVLMHVDPVAGRRGSQSQSHTSLSWLGDVLPSPMTLAQPHVATATASSAADNGDDDDDGTIAARDDLVHATQWLELLLLYRDRDNEKPPSRVTACLDSFTQAQAVSAVSAVGNDETSRGRITTTASGSTPSSAATPRFRTAVATPSHRSSGGASSPRRRVALRCDGLSQAAMIEHTTLTYVSQRRADREKRVMDALNAPSFTHPVLHVR